MRGKRLPAGLLAFLCCGHAAAVELPAIPDKAASAMFKDTPAPWRDYLIQARAAERIADPLQRCLAFPDLPGNQWPAGHAAAHCRQHFMARRPTLDEIGAMVERGEAAQLDALFDASLARHYATGEGFSDDLHDTFNYLLTRSDHRERVDRITTAWLALAPNSAYANLARGAYFNGAAWGARGSDYIGQTPKDNLRRMSALVDQALPYFDKALELNPRLIAAYTGLIDLGMLDSRPEVEKRGIEGAKQLDPACPELAIRTMVALTPRWGGSYEQMLAAAGELAAYVPQRPQLALQQAAPYTDRGGRLVADEQYTPEAAAVLDIAVRMASNERALANGARVALQADGDAHDANKALAYLLQDSRFEVPDAWIQRTIAWELVQAEPEWSLKYTVPAVAREPDNGLGHYLAGAGFYNVRRYEDADREYRLAIEDPDQRQSSLREVAEMWLWRGNTEDEANRKDNVRHAQPYIDRLVREYPDDGRGAIMAQRARLFVTRRVFDDELRAVLKKVDRTDPWQAQQAQDFERMLQQVEQARKAAAKPHA